MLTTKQDNLLSQRVFSGKKFILDTNIIFRMVGINGEERKFATDIFIKKCREVGIELYYTTETFSELFRVIRAQIKYIAYLTQGQSPISGELVQKMGYNYEPNDFYTLYYNWVKTTKHSCSDFVAFQDYVTSLLSSVLGKLKMLDIDNKNHVIGTKKFEELCMNLRKFKSEKKTA
jgi:hypothetical protein